MNILDKFGIFKNIKEINDALAHGYEITISNYAICWKKNGMIHRDDGPATIFADGAEFWYQNGKLHREDGPAVLRTDGTEIWYKNGKQHRVNGPAFIRADGYQEWWKNGVFIQ